MIWQDITFSAAGVALGYALIPQIVHGFKNKTTTIQAQTALITAVALLVCSITSLTLKLYLTSLVYFTSTILWTLLLYQAIRYKSKLINQLNLTITKFKN